MSVNVIALNQILKENQELAARASSNPLLKSPAWVQCPTNTSLWPSIPRLTGGTCINVCDTTGYYRCGASCNWTVPAGVTVAQFQMWGAGTGTVPGCCCSGSTFGSTGAYAIAILPVTAGSVYCICAGCAYCCYACQSNEHSAGGCPSYVIGPGLTNVCAEGGPTNYMACAMFDLHAKTCCRFQALGQTSAGPCLCSGGTNYCFANSCATCGEIPIIKSPRTFYGFANNGIVTGLNGLHGGGCLNTDHYGYMISAPVIGFDHTPFTGSRCCASFTSGSCCGGCLRNAPNGFFQFPGAGGFYNHMMGGSVYYAGDAGRMGMVRVTYC